MGKVRIGVSGWSYDSWRGDFYPNDLPKRRQLEYIGRHFDAVEVNGSFYSLLSPDTYRRYGEDTPPDFRFAVKGSRFITHNRLRHAIEIRNPDDLVPEVIRILRDAGVALVTSHAGEWPCAEELTAGFAYLRLHGAPEIYADRYGDRELARWAERIRSWRDGGEPSDAERITDRSPPSRKSRDVYVFFDNDSRGHAPHDARRLKEMVGS